MKTAKNTNELFCFISEIQNNLFDLFLFILHMFSKKKSNSKQNDSEINVHSVQKRIIS